MEAVESCMELRAVRPEMILAGLALALVPIAGWARRPWLARLPTVLAMAGVLAAMAATVPFLWAPPHEAFCGTYAVDPFRAFYQLLLEAGALLTLPMLASHLDGRPQAPHAPVAVLFATVGAMGLVASLDLGLIVLFLQMVSFPSYLLVGLVRTDRGAQEAVLKYFLYGAAALAVMAYGLTFLFGLTGSLNLRAIGAALAAGADPAWIAAALALVLVGYGFEATLVPFHFWAPDAYQGATAPIAGFVSVVPKVAAFAALLRFLLEALPDGLAGWPVVLAVLSVLTMSLGNLVALRQDSLKRLLAYSSIAQAGYVLMAVAVAARAPPEDALGAVGFYLLAYLPMNLAAFAVVALLERASGGDDAIRTARGLGRRAPWPAAALALALLSLAGIPPLAGFAGKVLLLSAAIDGGMPWLAALAAANMAVALGYYARVVAEMYFFAPAAGTEASFVATGLGDRLTVAAASAATVAFGVAPALGLGPARLSAALLG